MKRTAWFVTLAIINVFLASISIASFPLYRFAEKYLFYLIGFILGYNALAILALLFTRSLKNTLILSLVIGSFMIVFIHSPFRSMLPGGKPKMYQITLQLNAAAAPVPEKLSLTGPLPFLSGNRGPAALRSRCHPIPIKVTFTMLLSRIPSAPGNTSAEILRWTACS